MALDVATLGIRVDANGAITVLDQFGKKLGETQQKASLLEQGMGKLKSAAGVLGVSLGAGVIFHKFITETMESQRTMAQLEAVIRSTGMAAGFSAAQLSDTAAAMQQMTTYSDDAIMSAQSLLLTFTQIKGDTFTGATEAVANLATALRTDLKSAALQVGKALNDPAQGLAAMRRSGVSFSEAQQTVITLLFETGQKAEAQAMILKELNVQFGGAARAAKNTFGGALAGLNNSLGELFELSTDSTGAVVAFIQELDRAVRSLNEASGAIKGVAYTLGAAGLAGAIAIAGTGMAAMVGGIATLGEAFVAAQLYANAFWVAVTGPVGLAVAGLTTLAVVMAKISGDDAKANAAMKAREDADAYMAQQALKRHREKIKAEEELELQRRAASLQAAVDAKKRADADAAELAGLDAKIRRENVLAEAKQRVIDRINAEKEAARGLTPFAQVGIRDVPTVDETFTPEIPSPTNASGTAAIDGWLKMMKRLEAGWAAMSAAREQIEANFLRGLQDSFARTFENIFTHGLRGFKDLFASFGTLVAQAVAQLASSGLTTWIKSTYNAGASKPAKEGGGWMGGVNAIIGSVPEVGWIALAGTALFAMAASAKQATEDVKRMGQALDATFAQLRADVGDISQEQLRVAQEREKYNAARQQVIDKAQRELDAVNANPLTTRWHKDKRAEEINAAAQAEIDKLNALEERRIALLEKETAALKAYEEERNRSDLRARELRALGFNDEADALALFNRQVQEFQQAVKAGWSPEMLAYLAHVQELEAKQAAAAKTAQEAADAQKKLADAQQRAAEAAEAATARLNEAWQRSAEYTGQMADATEDLGVRLLKAQGQAEEAERKAFALQQSRELRAAQLDLIRLQSERAQQVWTRQNSWYGYTAPTVEEAKYWAQMQLSYDPMIAAAAQYIADLKNVQASEATAFANGQSMPGASSAIPGTAGSFGTIVSRATAAQGDRMVDELTTARVLAQKYWPYLKVIADKLTGGVNTLLGNELASAQTLSGSALVT